MNKIEDIEILSLTDIIKIAVFTFLFVFLITRVILPLEVEGDSMYPTIKDKDMVLVNKLDKAPTRGDIIVFCYVEYSLENLVKRVIAVGGDTLEVIEGEIKINGISLEESYIKEDWDGGPYSGTIQDGYMFVMGDNRKDSTDSRVFGLVSIEDVIGKVLFK